MKNIARFILSTLFVVSVSALPVMADWAFEADLTPCGVAGTPSGCGANPPASDPLLQGEVAVDEQGEVRVRLDGAAPNTTYTVFVGNWINASWFQPQFLGTIASCDADSRAIGTTITDNDGDYKGPVITPSGTAFVFPSGTRIGQLNFAFNNPLCGPTQFTTGMVIP